MIRTQNSNSKSRCYSIEESQMSSSGTKSFGEKSDVLSSPPPNQYFNLPSDLPIFSGAQSSTAKSSSDSTYASLASLPKYTYSSINMKSNRSGKFVMMVQVKYILIHRDIRGRR
uniref:Ovule protein n=1 Tax=Caenorhabditis tropicalis TaxID=1561998 RepID=A0A1I7UHJ5_9PELO